MPLLRKRLILKGICPRSTPQIFIHTVTVDLIKWYVQNDSIDSAIEIVNTELAKVALWFDSNKLTLNVNKTQMIMLSRKKILTQQNEIILRNEVVQRVNKAKFLGVIVDQHLNWKDHISMISQKISVMRHNISNS